jgi:hypothetical protein
VHLADSLGPVILVNHGRHELFRIICSGPRCQLLFSKIDLLVVQDSIDVGDDPVIGSGVNSFLEVLFGTPLGTLRSLLVKLS